MNYPRSTYFCQNNAMDLFLVQKKACDAVAAFRSKPHRFIVMRLVVGLRSYLFWAHWR